MRSNAVTTEEMWQLCKAGQGPLCCRYLGVDAEGICCLKHDLVFKKAIDARVEAGLMRAIADNCEGKH